VTAAIELEGVSLRHQDRLVLDGFSLSVRAGEIVALLGPSGSGKTTVLRLVLGFVAPSTGDIRLGGELVSTAGRIVRPPEERGVGMVFQDLALWPHLTVAGNLAFGLASMGVARRDREVRTRDMLERVGLGQRARSYPGTLSGGERQRVAIARALVLQPRAVLLDEPLSNLDAPLKRELLAMFRQLLAERQATALYVTHDVREAEALGERVAVMEGGRIVQDGSFDQLRSQPRTSFVGELIDEDFRGAGPPGAPGGRGSLKG
jgi:iron(III) transport system ATP-binding protein